MLKERLPPGATVVPVILASDKTELSRFKGDKTAWPVYLSVGNISKHIRRQPSKHASVLLGYLPVSKLASFEDNSVAGYRLFHYCMKQLVEPLVASGREGVEMVCADGKIRRIFPVLAAFIGDHPEQCLVACCAENRCPKCLVPPDQRGVNSSFPLRNQAHTVHVLHAQATGHYPPDFVADGLRPVFAPFWSELPHTDIFVCISSDILHQLHQGIFKDHFKKWCCALANKTAFDNRFRAMPSFPGLRHFKDGISKIKQWTGADHKQLQRVFVGALVGAVPDPAVVKAGRSLLDFIYLAQYHSHTDETLRALQNALNDFHSIKDVFINLGCRDHFNIPKLHSLRHYIETIRNLGSLDGVNTEHSERLHIDYAKKAYAASSRKDYVIQMTKWLQRQEAVISFKAFLDWRNGSPIADSTASASESMSETENDNTGSCPVSQPVYKRGAPTLSRIFSTGRRYHISQRPQFPNRTIQYLERHHGAACFSDALQTFLNTLPRARQFFAPNANDRFDIFSNLTILLSSAEHAPHKTSTRIQSHPQHSNGPRKLPTPARFDTVLVLVDDELRRHGGFHGKLALTYNSIPLNELFLGLRVAEVRAIFKLPPHLGDYPHPLAYVHWFKPMQTFDDTVQMFRVSRSSRRRLPNAEIVGVDRLVEPCHLIPRFQNGAVNPLWTRGLALDEADTFFLNRYADFRVFEQYRDHHVL